MAVTHKEIVKVWIAEGCIVCDACEGDCPEVFDVQETTCLIRPEAMKPDFTKPLTPSIITAAEGCPVDVIKFETIEVEGPEPWAGKEEAATASAGAGAGGGGGAAKKAGWTPPEGPPDPKWAGLLKNAHVSGSRSAGGPGVLIRPAAKAPAEAVVAMVDADAPPDAMSAALVGTGYARPQPSMAQRIRDKASRIASVSRRGFNMALFVGWGSMAFASSVAIAAFHSFLAPKISREPPSTFRAGKIADFNQPGVYEQHKDKNVWLVHLPDGKLVALSTICTHLGCSPSAVPQGSGNPGVGAEWHGGFFCPCHGSTFDLAGRVFRNKPAPDNLEVPPHMYLSDTRLLIGEDKKA